MHAFIRRRAGTAALALATLAATAGVARAQGAAPAAGAAPAVGTVAPDFTGRGATRYGLVAQPIKLSDFRGKTVVIAFFYQARTRG